MPVTSDSTTMQLIYLLYVQISISLSTFDNLPLSSYLSHHYMKQTISFSLLTSFRLILASILLLGLICVLSKKVSAQTNPTFNVSLEIDFNSAEQILDFFDRRTGNIGRVADLRGNRLAAVTSVMLARTSRPIEDFRQQLEFARDQATYENDIYGLLPAKRHTRELRKLLTEVKRRQLDRRVLATIDSYFPQGVKISTSIPVYIVAMGNERAAAVVRRVTWNGNTPTFVGAGSGEAVIILNLARMLEITPTVEKQFIELLSTLAHECFHATFSALKQSLPDSNRPTTLDDQLLDLVQNEGIAYCLSMQIRLGGQTPHRGWFTATSKAVETLNQALLELHSPNLTRARAQELLMNANLSGSFEGNYGATAGMRMAYEIDNRLGRPALTSTMTGGGRAFLSTYLQACLREKTLPQIDEQVLRLLRLNNQ